MTAAYSNEACALESPGPGGSLQWKEHMSGHWSAKGLGGRYDIYPAGTGGYKAYWEQSGTGTQHELGSYDTIGAAFGACRRHADGERRQTAAAEEDRDAVAKDVARKAVESAYGSGQVDHLSKSHPTTPGDPSFWNAWLKNGKRLTVHVNGSTGTVRDPDDGHVVATHTVSEAAEDRSRKYVSVKLDSESDARRFAGAILDRKLTTDRGGDVVVIISDDHQRARKVALEELDRLGLIGQLGTSPRGSYLFIHGVEEDCGCPHSHPKSVPTKPCAELSKVAKEGHEKPIVIEKTGEHSWVVFVQHNPIVNVAKRGAKPELSWKGRKNYVEGSRRHIFKTRGEAEGVAHQVGRYVLNLGDFVFSYVEYKNDVPSATETVPVIHEANDAGPFATIDRDPKEFAKGKALGKANTPAKAYKIVRKSLERESQEVFLVLPMDLHGELLSRPVEVARGQRDRVAVGPSDVIRPVTVHNAKGFVVVHNHPSGHAKPSPKDRDLTKTIRKDTPSDVVFLDHLVIGSKSYYSFAENEPELFK